ncbi:MAG: hypothetical protein LAP40_20365 [Acidobacteriia bacterium]|nr:hypothetical protein [Terriglobia bacterium]
MASAALLAIFTFNPLIFANQLVYVPATAAMLFSYVAFRHERQAAQEAVGRYP